MTDIKWPEWQLIKTAPRDGTPVLLCGGYDEYWDDCVPNIDEKSYTPTRAWWDGDSWIMTRLAGVRYIAPTHWMPLPPMPGERND